MNRGWALALCLVAIAGLGIRSARLAARPLHSDEAVNAIRLSDYWSDKSYRYNPHEYHGPTLYYANLPLLWLSGTRSFSALRETTLRLTPALFGVGLILLLAGLADGLGRRATLVAALLTALSPALVYYSRHYIHEMLLAFFTLLAGVGAWRWTQTRRVLWAGVAGAGVGLMYATKETFIFCLVALFGALILTAWGEGGMKTVRAWARTGWGWPLVAALAAAIVLSQLLFTSFLTNPSGPLDSLRTYIPWMQRAAGDSPHIHPWYFYLERLLCFHRPKGLWWSEGLILLLGGVGMLAAATRRGVSQARVPLVRILALYTLGLTAIYCLIAYKTPWCLVGFWHGWIVLAGVGTVALFQWIRPLPAKIILSVVLLAGGVHLGWQTWQANFVRAADWRNPYVYAQTSPDLLRLVEQVEQLAQTHPDGPCMLVKVVAPDSDYWPLPWYFRNLTRVGWYESLPDDPFAPVVVSAVRLGAYLDERSDKKWLLAGLYEHRARVFLELYVELELWKAWLEKNARAHPRPAAD